MQASTDQWLVPVIEAIAGRGTTRALENGSGSLWQRAVVRGIVTDDAILNSLAAASRLAVAPTLASSATARARVPERLARRYCALPLAVSRDHIDVAVANPYDLECEAALAFASGKRVRMSLASPSQIAEHIDAAYGSSVSIADLIATLGDSAAISTADAAGAVSIASAAPIVQLVDRLVADGVAARASDIHIEREDVNVAVRYRVDGTMQPALLLPRHVGLALASRIKIMSGMDIADRLRPQGGRASLRVGGEPIDLRVSTLPAAHGEKVVVRILDQRTGARSLDALGIDPDDATRLRRLLETREGLILVTGPTGSGKTTTLYAALRELLARGLNIVTVEDPVEYRIPGIVQSQVNEKAGLTFAAALRSILRQDPDVILIGEVRDEETAAIAIQAALTGHLVFATLHTVDAASSIARLHDLGIEPAKIAVALKGILAQRLVRRICEGCRGPSDEPVPYALWNDLPSGARLPRGTGCAACTQSGFRGRVPVIELIEPTTSVARLIADGAAAAVVRAAARTGKSRSLWAAGVARVVAGETTPEEIGRVIDEERECETIRDIEDEIIRPSPRSDRGSDDPTNAYLMNASRSRAPAMTAVHVGVVDVYIVDVGVTPWRALILQRSRQTRCPGAWEAVHGRIEGSERPEDAAIRELREETGLSAERLYNVTVHAFYLQQRATVELAVVFCAFVDSSIRVTTGSEHAAHEWVSLDEAARRCIWPRAAQAFAEIRKLFATGDAGPAEDVLRVR